MGDNQHIFGFKRAVQDPGEDSFVERNEVSFIVKLWNDFWEHSIINIVTLGCIHVDKGKGVDCFDSDRTDQFKLDHTDVVFDVFLIICQVHLVFEVRFCQQFVYVEDTSDSTELRNCALI